MSKLIKLLVKRLETLRNKRMSLARQMVAINSEMKEIDKLVGKHIDKMKEDTEVIKQMLGEENKSDQEEK